MSFLLLTREQAASRVIAREIEDEAKLLAASREAYRQCRWFQGGCVIVARDGQVTECYGVTRDAAERLLLQACGEQPSVAAEALD